jgi:hypothetical protein
MRRVTVLVACLLTGCSTNPPPSNIPAPPTPPVTGESAGAIDPTPVHGITPGHKCTTAETDRFIGLRGNSAIGAAIKHASNAAVLRWSPPNTMLTMDYREDRVTVWIDAAKKITKIRCG